MNMADLDTSNTDRLRGELRRDEPMARHVSWRAGGVASTTYAPADLADLQCFLRTLPAGEPVFMVGLGSNLLVRDGGLRGTVVFTHRALGRLRLVVQTPGGADIHVEAGVASPKVARFAAVGGLAGAEFLAGVPGTLGGALAMNAGCYGGETWNVVKSVVTVDRRGTLHERTPADYVIGYRTVVPVPAREEWFVSATLHFARGDADGARSRIRELLSRRIASQPLGQPNAGSVFRNPPGDHAARLIEACGLKGRVIGGAVISAKHANFIVNLGNARAADIEALIALAQAAVKQKFGLTLECEVRIVGEAA
jgi:UDP-N-acetylmuramate dehydrogenase